MTDFQVLMAVVALAVIALVGVAALIIHAIVKMDRDYRGE
jgi:di/tricarboxylate transporter